MTVRRSDTFPMIVLAILFCALTPTTADAHVKWFCGPIDGSIPPVAIDLVLSPLFLLLAVLFLLLVSAGGLIDAVLARALPRAVVPFDTVAMPGEILLRVGMAAYTFCLWRNLAVVPWADGSTGSILTPELLNRERIVGLVQLATAILLLIPPASSLAAIGLATLFAIGVAGYGLFYMIDYLFFLGAAAFVALSDPGLRRYPGRLRWRVPILTITISFSLMWTAVEKFLFPQWTISVLVLHPGLTAGYPFSTVATIAGFVEFSLAFYLLVGREILGRVCAVLLMIVFLIAMPEFGMVDMVGHISVITILLVVMMHGQTQLQDRLLGLNGTRVLVVPVRVAMLYVVMLAGLMMLYYGLHAASQYG